MIIPKFKKEELLCDVELPELTILCDIWIREPDFVYRILILTVDHHEKNSRRICKLFFDAYLKEDALIVVASAVGERLLPCYTLSASTVRWKIMLLDSEIRRSFLAWFLFIYYYFLSQFFRYPRFKITYIFASPNIELPSTVQPTPLINPRL